MKNKKELLCSYDGINSDYQEDYKLLLIDGLEDDILMLEEDLKDVKVGSNLYKKLQEKIKEKEKEIEEIKNDNHIYEREGYDEFSQQESEWLWEDFKSCVNSEWKSGYYIVTGSMGLWNGKEDIKDISYYNDIDEFISKLNSVDRIKAEYYSDGTLEWTHIHHDGRNSYTVKPLLSLSKQELIDIVEGIMEEKLYNEEDTRELCKEMFGKTFTQLNKDELETLIIEFN